MTNRTTLIQRATSLVIAAAVTLAMLGSIDRLAARDLSADSLLAQQTAAAQTA